MSVPGALWVGRESRGEEEEEKERLEGGNQRRSVEASARGRRRRQDQDVSLQWVDQSVVVVVPSSS